MHWFLSDAMSDIFHNNFSFHAAIITSAVGKTEETAKQG